jgi:hypothetical protein
MARNAMNRIRGFMSMLRSALMGGSILLGAVPSVNSQVIDAAPMRLIDRLESSPADFRNMAASDDGEVVAVYTSGRVQFAGLPPFTLMTPSQVIVIDRRTGAVELASRTPAGAFQNATRFAGPGPISISRDGRFVAFVSTATNLDPAAAAPGWYTYLYDRATRQVRALSADGVTNPLLEGIGLIDGAASKFVFPCLALAAPLAPGEFAFCTRSLADGSVRITRAGFPGAVPSDGGGGNPFALSRDGSKVAISRNGTILTTGAPNPERVPQVYLLDLETQQIELVSQAVDGTPGNGSLGSGGIMALSDDGDFVAFNTDATNLGSGLVPGAKIVVKQRSTGIVRRASTVNPFGSIASHLSGDGRRLLYLDYGFYLSNNDIVRVYDWETNTNRPAGRPPGVFADNLPCGAGLVFQAPPIDYWQRIAISGDGRSLIFASLASNLFPGDTPNSCDLFAQALGPVPQPPTAVSGLNSPLLALLFVLVFAGGCTAAWRPR